MKDMLFTEELRSAMFATVATMHTMKMSNYSMDLIDQPIRVSSGYIKGMSGLKALQITIETICI